MSETKTIPQSAVLIFRKGPEKGKTFQIRDEMVHLGSGEESDFRLHAKDLQDYELSIVLRNQRYAIYAARGDIVSVEGNSLPAEKWVWLPESATIQVGDKTTFEFETRAEASAVESESTAGKKTGTKQKSRDASKETVKKSRVRQQKKESKPGTQPAHQRNVARFITDQVGDPLVQLGEDGHLPELHLEEISGDKKKKSQDSEQGNSESSNPLLLGAALAFSVISSTLLMIMDVGTGGRASVDKTSARVEIQSYYGGENEELEDYQLLLREAALSHSRGDHAEERRYYRRVLQMLVSEDNQGLIRLTETRERDLELRDLLSTLLAQ